METVQVRLPPKLIPVFDGPADVRGSKGGRGSGKTRSFAKMLAVRGYMFGNQGVSGQLLCCRQYMNSLDDSSLEECKRAIQEDPWLSAYYDIGEKYIKSRDGRIWFNFAGLDRSISSVKSKGRILICWIDEAEPVTEYALQILEPTLREEGEDWHAELWVTWNPRRKFAAVEKFANSKDPMIKIAELNWKDNPMFPAKLERQRQRDLVDRPESYGHIWDGEFETVVQGAYYTKQLLKAKQENRIGRVARDPLHIVRLFADIGGTGAKSDNFVFWAAQFIGKEIRVLNHHEAQGQELSYHLNWMRENDYNPDNTKIWLPHDGRTHDKVFSVSYESAFEEAGYKVEVVPNQGPGAAKQRIEAVKRLFPSMWIHEETTEAGRQALAWYHEKWDEERSIGLGPAHDWASHSADAYGLMCVAYEEPMAEKNKEPDQSINHYGASGWMA